MKRAKPGILKLVLLLIVVYSAGWLFVTFLYSPCKIDHTVSVYVHPGENQDQVLDTLIRVGKIENLKRLKFLLKMMDFEENIHPGRYELKPGITNFRIARMLSNGMQTPVRMTFNNMRTVEDLAGRLSDQLMSDSLTILTAFRDTVWRDSMGLTKNNYMAVFIPNTYEVYWNTTTDKLIELFQKEYRKFWDESKMSAARKIGLTPVEVSTLASIVEEETNKSDEMPKVAGLYLNRLRIDMPLQADPTVKFAVGDFTIKRILIGHTKVSSPYNTYRNIGLPPGPIRIPSIRAIQAVLTPSRHSYLYMCAKNDFSGYHAFATTLSQHNDNAAAYHQALNSNGILQ